MKTKYSRPALAFMLAGLLSFALAGCDKRQETDPAVPGTKAATAVDDSMLTTKVKAALIADSAAYGADVNVETRNGEVQLSGPVASQAQMDRAVLVAGGVEGVKTVKNNMTVKTDSAAAGSAPATGASSAAAKAGAMVDDTVVTTKVKSALLADPDVKGLDISVVTRNGEVQLSGMVDNAKQQARAVEVARSVEGVQKVADQMSIKKKTG